ncbi:hyaluronan mediated motility receptor [Drosophila serrata]|uniref:hyaluronan mediated motility receptor n=1 Tax=Drosophila serrata TaxID=7274 RepID=UPI000A1D0CEB|nr:hyaluronan mediated motility receptor [Drosophila serrata]
MWPKSPRIRQNNPSGFTTIQQKASPRALYSKTLIANQLKNVIAMDNVILAHKDINKQQLDKKTETGLLTPSSSDNSLTTSATSSEQSSDMVAKLPKTRLFREPSSLTPYLTIKRQNTASMINFRVRKSVSQMDFKEARRTGNYQLVAHVPSPRKVIAEQPLLENASEELKADLGKLTLQDADTLIKSGDGQVSFLVGPEQDARVASLRIFNTIMLHAWRKRRHEVGQLKDQVDDLKKNLVKNRNQLHVYNSLFCVEQRRNATLNDQLRQSYRDNAQIKLSYEDLSLVLVEVRTEKEKLSAEVAAKNENIENLEEEQKSLKNELLELQSQQREQMEQLTRLQLDFQESQCVRKELTQQQELLLIDVTLKQDFIEKLRESTAKLEELKKAADEQYSKLLEHTLQLETSIQEKDDQLVNLQNCLAATLGQRIRQCFAHSQNYQHATYRMLHFVAHYMLPGTPPPSTPPLIQWLSLD